MSVAVYHRHRRCLSKPSYLDNFLCVNLQQNIWIMTVVMTQLCQCPVSGSTRMVTAVLVVASVRCPPQHHWLPPMLNIDRSCSLCRAVFLHYSNDWSLSTLFNSKSAVVSLKHLFCNRKSFKVQDAILNNIYDTNNNNDTVQQSPMWLPQL